MFGSTFTYLVLLILFQWYISVDVFFLTSVITYVFVEKKENKTLQQ
jgi:hypothetical protein